MKRIVEVAHKLGRSAIVTLFMLPLLFPLVGLVAQQAVPSVVRGDYPFIVVNQSGLDVAFAAHCGTEMVVLGIVEPGDVSGVSYPEAALCSDGHFDFTSERGNIEVPMVDARGAHDAGLLGLMQFCVSDRGVVQVLVAEGYPPVDCAEATARAFTPPDDRRKS